MGILSHWKSHDCGRACPGGAPQFDASSVLLRDPLGNRQAESGTPWIPASRWIRAVEAVEDVLQILGGNPDARVMYQRASLTFVGAEFNRDGSVRRCVLDCVIEQDEKEL